VLLLTCVPANEEEEKKDDEEEEEDDDAEEEEEVDDAEEEEAEDAEEEEVDDAELFIIRTLGWFFFICLRRVDGPLVHLYLLRHVVHSLLLSSRMMKC